MRLLTSILLLFLSANMALAIDFSIGNPSIAENYITIDATLSGTATNNYLQAILRREGSSRYFGETLGSQGTYLDYVSSPDKDFIANNFVSTNVQNASWSGQIKLRYKTDDTLYLGPGTYELKARRFTGGSSGYAGESNTLLINLTLPLPTPTPTPTPTPATSAKPDSSPTATPIPSPSAAGIPTASVGASPSPVLSPAIVATVQGIFTSSPSSLSSPSQSMPPATSKNVLAVNPSRLKIVLGIGSGILTLAVSIILSLRKNIFPGIIKE